MKKWIPLLVVLLVSTWVLATMVPNWPIAVLVAVVIGLYFLLFYLVRK